MYPDNADLHFLKGVNNYLLKNYDKAIEDFDRTVRLNPEYDDAYLYRARAKKANDDLIGALRDYNKAKNENFTQTMSSLAGDVIKSIFGGKRNK
jgi:tetratricopeptide (TPR) repeat protein